MDLLQYLRKVKALPACFQSANADVPCPFPLCPDISHHRTISLWTTTKKKAIFNYPLAHGVQEYHSETEGVVHNPRWIVSLASLPYSDLFASGSWDGQVRLWKISTDIRSFSPLASIDAVGIVNSLQLRQVPPHQPSSSTTTTAGQQKKSVAKKEDSPVMLTAALAQEHKYGRWQRVEKAKNVALLALLDPAVSS